MSSGGSLVISAAAIVDGTKNGTASLSSNTLPSCSMARTTGASSPVSVRPHEQLAGRRDPTVEQEHA